MLYSGSISNSLINNGKIYGPQSIQGLQFSFNKNQSMIELILDGKVVVSWVVKIYKQPHYEDRRIIGLITKKAVVVLQKDLYLWLLANPSSLDALEDQIDAAIG